MAKNGHTETKYWYADSGGYRCLALDWKQESQNFEKNTTTISYTLKGAGSYTGWVNVRNISLSINGTTVYQASGPIKVYVGTVLKSGTVTIPHNTNGSKSFSIYIECGIYYSTINSTVQVSQTLETIPRATTITATDGYIGEECTITMKKASSNYGHAFWWRVGNGDERRINGTPSGNLYKFTIPKDIYKLIPNDKSAKVTIRCDTTYNSTTIGSTTCTFTAKVKEETNKPDLTVEKIIDNNQRSQNILNNPDAFIKGVSNAAIKNINAKSKNSATITSIKIQNGEQVYNNPVSNETEKTMNLPFPQPQSAQFLITATDSRGFSTTVTKIVAMFDYFNPKIAISAKRLNQTSKQIRVDFEGIFCNNALSTGMNLRCSYKIGEETRDYLIASIKADGTVFAYFGEMNYNSSDYTFSGYALLNQDFDYQTEYGIVFNLSDVLNDSIRKDVSIPRGIPIFDWGENDFNFNVPVNFSAAVNFSQPAIVDDDPVADTVIEQGTKNVTDPNTNKTVAWGYRKWANGTGECWISREVTCNVTSKWGTALYYGTVSTINFPFKFAEVPVVNVSCEYTTADDKSLFIASCGYSSQNYARPIMLCRTDSGTFNCKLLYQVIGRYETEQN